MGERPSYRPWLWGTRWPLVARWAKDRPDRVIAWCVGAILATAVLLAIAAMWGSTLWVVLLCVALLYGVIDAGVHVPRARRAMLTRAPDSN